MSLAPGLYIPKRGTARHETSRSEGVQGWEDEQITVQLFPDYNRRQLLDVELLGDRDG
jgi:hypothetical protein